MLFDSAFDAIIILNDAGKYLDVNPSACKLFERSREQLLECDLNVFDISNFDFSYTSRNTQQPVKGTLYLTESEIVKQAIEYTLTPSFSPCSHLLVLREMPVLLSGKNQHSLTETQTIQAQNSEYKQQEEHSRLQSAALKACASAIVITDRHGNIQWVNLSFARLTGYTPEEVIRKNPREIVNSGFHQKEFFQTLWNTILAGNVWRGEITNRRKDGSLYIEEMTVTPVHNEQGRVSHFIAIKQDISDRKQLEIEQDKRNSRLQLQQFVMMNLSQSGELYSGNLDTALIRITQAAAHILDVERSSVWWLNDDYSEIYYAILYHLNQHQHSSGE